MSTELAEKVEETGSHSDQPFWLSGFLVLGVLVGVLGSLLIAWGYHIDGDPAVIGLHFLGLNAGYVLAVPVSQRLMRRTSVRAIALLGCAVGCLSLVALAIFAPPMAVAWRIGALTLAGYAGGSLATALLHGLEPYYAQSPGPALNRSGILLGAGCALATVVTGIVYAQGWQPAETVALAAVPLGYFFYFLLGARHRSDLSHVPHKDPDLSPARNLQDLRVVAASLFTLLLFFQFGNEWAIAGWLPMFLVHRLGSNPVWAIFALAGYFLILTMGRVLAQKLLPRVSHRKLLVSATVLAMFGDLLLSLSPWLAGAYVGIVLVGAGFGPVYPLVSEYLDERFSYHPGFYNSIFSVAITGAMCAPWLLGYVDLWLGIKFVMLIPAFGSVAVLVLVLLLMFEAHLMREPAQSKMRHLV